MKYFSFETGSEGTADMGCKPVRQGHLSGGLCLWMLKALKTPELKQNPRQSVKSADKKPQKQ
jgi:hypothetical protein